MKHLKKITENFDDEMIDASGEYNDDIHRTAAIYRSVPHNNPLEAKLAHNKDFRNCFYNDNLDEFKKFELPNNNCKALAIRLAAKQNAFNIFKYVIEILKFDPMSKLSNGLTQRVLLGYALQAKSTQIINYILNHIEAFGGAYALKHSKNYMNHSVSLTNKEKEKFNNLLSQYE